MSSFGGKFWAIREEQSEDDPEEEEDVELRSPAAVTLGDAFGCAKGRRSKQRKGRKADLKAIAQRLRDVVATKTSKLSAEARPFLGAARQASSPIPASVVGYAPSPESSDDGGDWFQIIGGRPYRVPSRADPSSPHMRRDDARPQSASADSSPASTPSRSPAGLGRNPGDDVNMSVDGTRVSIRSVGRCGPIRYCSNEAQERKRDEVISIRVAPHAGTKSPNQTRHLDPFLSHLWCSAQDSRGGADRGDVMGDRFGPGRGGGHGGADGGGRGAGNNHQFGPPQRPHQGNIPHNQNNQFRGQNYNQYRGPAPNYQYQNQSSYGYQNNYGNQSNQSRGQYYNNSQRSQSAGSSNPPGAQNKQASQSYVQKNSSSAGESVAAQKETTTVAAAEGVTTKLQCFRCWIHGDHVTKDCKADVLCVNCDKTSHISTRCAWLHQKKPVASFVGFGGEGLSCFVAEHTKEVASGSKGNATAIVRIQEDQGDEVSSDKLELGLGSTYPWRWAWKAKKVAAGVFLVEFPSVARINEVALYDWVPLKQAKIMVNIKLWTDESLAAGKLTTVWVRAKGVPKTLKNFHGLCEVGSTLGQHLEADMDHLKQTGQVRLKVGVVNHLKIPKWTQISTSKLLYYRIYFQLEEIVEMGWDRDEEDFIQDFDDMLDSQPEETEDRDPKRQKNGDPAALSPSGLLFPVEKTVVASTKTRMALEQREQNLRKQDEEDVGINLQKGGQSLLSQFDNEKPNDGLLEHSEDNGVGKESSGRIEEERVRLSDDELDEGSDASQSDSFGDKVMAYTGGVSNAGGLEKNQKATETRYSSRLADKNLDDVSILEKAKNFKAKNSDKDEGVGGRKAGTTNGRKTAGASRG